MQAGKPAIQAGRAEARAALIERIGGELRAHVGQPKR